MRILLVAVNAKYIHTNPAVYSLRACALAALRNLEDGPEDVRIDIAAYTINDRYQDVLAGIMGYGADIIGFSVYIWNVDRVRRLIRDIRRIRGSTVSLWVGGPEASWYPEPFLREDGADLCMVGEGEVVFTKLIMLERAARRPDVILSDQIISDTEEKYSRYENLPGLAFLRGEMMVRTGTAQVPCLDEIPFLYQDIDSFAGRIIYYEASRGCPFSCAYCLSGKERGVRYRAPETVERELQFFLDHKVRQVKFVDRTFNADPVFALRIWRYIQAHDNGITNFHFEIEGDRITEDELLLLAELRPGLVQMEIGVQSANPQTLRSVHRSPDIGKIGKVMEKLVRNQNINLHLDLIAGLPYEGMESFRASFNTVYAMRPHQLQLGFLKLLKGTELYDRREEYGLVCSADSPYEVLKTKWLSFDELELLHRVSDRVEEYVNTQGFRRSLPEAEKLFPDPFSLFAELDSWYRKNGYDKNRPSVQKRYEIFMDFVADRAEKNTQPPAVRKLLSEMIRFDMALHTHASRRMISEETFDLGDGPLTIRIDHTRSSPVHGEASYERIWDGRTERKDNKEHDEM